MNLKIGKKIEKQFKNCYILAHNYMIGDADGDYDFKNVISKDNPFLIPYIETLENFISDIKGVYSEDISFSCFEEFYENLDKTVENYGKFIQEIKFDKRSEGDLGWYSYKGYSISFFDENGDNFKVEIS